MTRTPADHRLRVAAERRARMRRQLMDATIRLIAESGPDAISIDSVVQAAGVARGTFYNYFTTPADLLRAVGLELTEDLIVTVDQAVRLHNDPATRLAVGTRAILRYASGSSVLAAVILHSGWPSAGKDHALHRVVARDVATGLTSRRFRAVSKDVAMALLGGLTVGVMPAFLQAKRAPDMIGQVAETLLLGLGVPGKEAATLARVPFTLPQPRADGLLVRLLKPAGGDNR